MAASHIDKILYLFYNVLVVASFAIAETDKTK